MSSPLVLIVSFETGREGVTVKLIGSIRVSTKQQSTDRQEADLLAAEVVMMTSTFTAPSPGHGHHDHSSIEFRRH